MYTQCLYVSFWQKRRNLKKETYNDWHMIHFSCLFLYMTHSWNMQKKTLSRHCCFKEELYLVASIISMFVGRRVTLLCLLFRSSSCCGCTGVKVTFLILLVTNFFLCLCITSKGGYLAQLSQNIVDDNFWHAIAHFCFTLFIQNNRNI